MDIVDFAREVLAMNDELCALRSENWRLHRIVDQYEAAQREQFDHNNAMFCKVLGACLDPDSHINQVARRLS